ncbi:MAG: hypothetical protein ABIH21_02035 [Patescibacteria group bacterium]
MSKTPNFDNKIKPKLDSLQQEEILCPVSGQKWQRTQEEIYWLIKFQVPPSDWSPTVRRKNLIGFNTGMNIWWNRHAFTGKPLISYIHPDNKIKALPDSEWHSYDWAEKEKREPCVDKPFLDQMRELLFSIPMPAARLFGEPKNSIGVSIISAEDSFMVVGGVQGAKRTSYAYTPKDTEDCQDLLWATSCSNSFCLIHCLRMHSCRVALHCHDCMASSFLFDCYNCENCFMSSNLRNKKFVFENQQLSPDEYRQRISQIDLTSYKLYQEYFDKFLQMVGKRAVWPEHFNIQCEDCDGDYMVNCLRCHDVFSVIEGTDGYMSQLGHTVPERFAYTSGIVTAQDVYMSVGITKSANIKFSTTITRCANMEYCYNCVECEDCFGCVGIKNRKNCILNTQFDEASYWQMVDTIKCAMLERGEYGKYFPGDFSMAGVVQASELFYDLKENEKEAFGAVAFDPARGAVLSEQQSASMAEPALSSSLPDELAECSDLVGKPILDEILHRPYTVREPDFQFYKHNQLPFPRNHFVYRLKYYGRMANTFFRQDGACKVCGKEIRYAVNQMFVNRKVYCHDCYLKYVEEHG